MVEIHTLSAADFKQTMQDNDLHDGNVEQRTDLAVISIGNSFEDELADEIFANGPSSHWFKAAHNNVLNLDFDDITEGAFGAVEFGEGYVVYSEGTKEVNVTDLQSGFYLYRVVLSDGSVAQGKFVKK